MSSDGGQDLRDREAIAWALHEYCRALDVMDLDAIAALFTPDCVVDYGPDVRLQSRGAGALATDLQRLWRWARTSHHLSNVQIALDGPDRARANSYVIAWHERPDGTTATLWGQYQDELTRTPAGWRIARRRQVMNGNDVGFTVEINPLERCPPPPGWVAPRIER